MDEEAFFAAQNWTTTVAQLPGAKPLVDLEEWYDSGTAVTKYLTMILTVWSFSQLTCCRRLWSTRLPRR